MSRFLVTGGAGFIGSHITGALVRRGHFVRVLDNFSSGKKENLSGVINKIEIFRGDICSAKACLRAARGMDFVFHEAALRSVPGSMKEPELYNKVNIGGTLNMLKASASCKVKRFVLASSSAVYGEVGRFPQKESFLPMLVSPYALSKLAGEYYCSIFSRFFGLETVSLRYFNVFGPRQALDDEYAVVIPKFITCMLNDKEPPIYGTGKQSRDFVYIDNVVSANILAATRPGVKAGVFNVASGKNYSVLELVSILNKIMGKSVKPAFLKVRAGDVFKTLADVSLAKKKLGFIPKVDFAEGLRETAEYFKNA